MDILSILKAEHDHIRDGFTKLARAGGVKARQALFEELVQDIQMHLTLEKEYLYPELAQLFAGAEALVDIGQANGAAIGRRLKNVSKLATKPSGEKDGYDKKEADLRDSVLKHFDFAEQSLMPKVRGLVRTEEREDIGQLFLDVKDEMRRGLKPPVAKPVAINSVTRRRA